MKKQIYFIFFISFILLNLSCKKNEVNNFDFAVSYYKDLQKKENISTIVDKKMKPLTNPNLGYENGTYWFKVSLKDPKKIPDLLIFNISGNRNHKVLIFDEHKEISYKNTEKSHPALLVNHKKDNAVYYLQIQFKKQVYFELQLKKHTISQQHGKYNYFEYGLYYGFVAMVLVLNFFLFISLKDKSFLYYCIFLLAITFSILAFDNLLKGVLPDSFLFYYDLALHFLIALFGAIFVNHFLDLRYHIPKSYKLTVVLLTLGAINYVFFVVTQNNIFISIGDTFCLLTLIYYWLLGIVIYKKHEFAKFFVVGYALILFSTIFYNIPINWGLHIPSVSIDAVKFGSLFEMLILSYAITYRIKILQEENELFKKEINAYLNKIKKLEFDTNKTFKIEEELLKTKYDLSSKQIKVLLLIYKGYTNQRISDELFISLNTVKYHIRNIYEKLNIKSKIEAIDVFTDIKNAT